ncbi:MAG: 50S ribosomal protein L29 [Bacteroidales bacterium]|jgi:large subunit ribosomal protein L29|nr:50S ribosomal protein L29 [Bacteroidales bacterium]MDD2771626.1 50S ribosomal protein L29 [Bacteroidales bacterium]MDD3105199.1 50S ribosomal protein L29 [Bacteroidales bacterium]MDD3550214.1 50S ribosomal protein L29 [Bacteroidales bacterium]MDD4063940.1 50S ribosomal protein L29 [Bacteroidales bacterium]
MKAPEIRELSVKDLSDRIEAEKANLLRLKMNHAISPVDDLSQIKKARRNIARMLTILSETKAKQNLE